MSDNTDIPDKDLWNTFNLGIGFCVVLPADYTQAIIDISSSHGFKAWDIGLIEEEKDPSQSRILGLPALI